MINFAPLLVALAHEITVTCADVYIYESQDAHGLFIAFCEHKSFLYITLLDKKYQIISNCVPQDPYTKNIFQILLSAYLKV